jgi:YtcA family
MNTESTPANRPRISRRCIAQWGQVIPLLLTGCSHSPEYSIFGSFFPAWIFCSAGGLILAAGARAVVARSAVAEYLTAPVLLYLSMAVLLACVLWLLFYS